MSDLNPAAIMDEHALTDIGWCRTCCRLGGPMLRTAETKGHCQMYRLAEALAAERAKVQRVEALSELDSNTYVNVLDLRAALAAEGAADQPQPGRLPRGSVYE